MEFHLNLNEHLQSHVDATFHDESSALASIPGLGVDIDAVA